MRRALAWSGFGQGTYFILQFAGSVVIARLLGPYDTGIFAVAMAVIGLVGVVQSVGLDAYLVRERELTPDIVGSAATVNAIIALIMALAIFLLGLLGERLFAEYGVRELLTLLAVVPLIGCTAFVPQTMLGREGDFRTLSLIRAGSTLFGLLVTVGLAWRGYRYMSFGYSQLATAIISNSVLTAVAWRHARFRPSLSHWRAMSRFGVQIFAIAGLSRVAGRIMDLVLGRTLGITALGFYSRASGNHTQIWDSVHGVVSRVAFVDFAHRAREGQPLAERYLLTLYMMTGLLWPLFGGAAVLAGPLIYQIYGPAWHRAAAPLALLCLASVLLVSITMAWEVFVVREDTGRQVRIEAIRTLAGTALFVAGCFVSLEAAAAARVGEALLAQALYRPHIARLTNTPQAAFRAVYVKSGLAAVAAVAPALGVMVAWRFTPDAPLPFLTAAVAAGVLAWLTSLRALDHPLFAEIALVMARTLRLVRVS